MRHTNTSLCVGVDDDGDPCVRKTYEAVGGTPLCRQHTLKVIEDVRNLPEPEEVRDRVIGYVASINGELKFGTTTRMSTLKSRLRNPGALDDVEIIATSLDGRTAVRRWQRLFRDTEPVLDTPLNRELVRAGA